jgi:hypothetical protein
MLLAGLVGCPTTAKEGDTPEMPPAPKVSTFTPAADLADQTHQNIKGESPEIPPAPKVSTFAPAADLANQADRYIKELDEYVANEADYADNKDQIALKSNTLIIIALALGLHDVENKHQAHAGALMKAAQAVAVTKDFESAKKSVAALKAAAEGKVKSDVTLKWEKSASLPELMKEVPLVNTRLKRYIKPAKFKDKAKESAGCTAVLAAIAQGSIADTTETKNPEQVKQWFKFMGAMRDHAGSLNAAIHKGDEPAGAAAMKKLQQSCDDCHTVFHTEALKKTSE